MIGIHRLQHKRKTEVFHCPAQFLKRAANHTFRHRNARLTEEQLGFKFIVGRLHGIPRSSASSMMLSVLGPWPSVLVWRAKIVPSGCVFRTTVELFCGSGLYAEISCSVRGKPSATVACAGLIRLLSIRFVMF